MVVRADSIVTAMVLLRSVSIRSARTMLTLHSLTIIAARLRYEARAVLRWALLDGLRAGSSNAAEGFPPDTPGAKGM